MLRRAFGLLLPLVLLISFLWTGSSEAEPRFPRPVGYVNDFANMISPQAESIITGIAREVKAKTGAELAVATIATTGGIDVEEYAVDLFMDWGIGERGKDNGVLILVALNDRQLWIKPGYGLEGAIPDAEAHRIYRDVLRPGFRAGKYDQALVTASRMIAERILSESGHTFAFADSVPGRYVLRPGAGARRRTPSTGAMIAFIVFVLFFFTIAVIAGLTGRYGRRGGFWTGGGGWTGSSSGGFGGGFGGFGGGSAGGGGAGGGW